ncbi:FG-GAP-like repeat-containing protein [Streptomyces axinellae]|uniref:Uncharacterized protein n=1 Tax=Streptomyces axinellae TaxID=552788 RepID=A0ABP6C6M9_9ACTN
MAGDFDGDGRLDLALGDSGIPSDEEAEPEDRPGKVTIRYGKAPGAPVVIEGGPRKGGFGVELAAGDLDGDGCDDLAVERAGDRDGGTDGTDVLHGGSSPGLGSRPWLPARPHRAGHPTAADDLFGDGRDALLLDSGVRKKNGWGWWFTDLAGKEPAHYDKDQLGHTAQTSRGGR